MKTIKYLGDYPIGIVQVNSRSKQKMVFLSKYINLKKGDRCAVVKLKNYKDEMDKEWKKATKIAYNN